MTSVLRGSRPSSCSRSLDALVDPPLQLLDPARRAHRPAVVAEVPHHLAADRRTAYVSRSLRGARVEPVHRLGESLVGDLDQVVLRDPTAPVARGNGSATPRLIRMPRRGSAFRSSSSQACASAMSSACAPTFGPGETATPSNGCLKRSTSSASPKWCSLAVFFSKGRDPSDPLGNWSSTWFGASQGKDPGRGGSICGGLTPATPVTNRWSRCVMRAVAGTCAHRRPQILGLTQLRRPLGRRSRLVEGPTRRRGLPDGPRPRGRARRASVSSS